ncbi:MAG: hypothetical protein IT243_00480 [Bacteroidia bacterium]|nr:hypothetical protein [Bacteroidia bacterium]
MQIVYKFRVNFEEHEDVVRIVEIDSTSSFADLHTIIQQSVGFDASKQYEFYLSDESWRVNDKVCSSDVDNKEPGKTILNRFINDPNQKFIYIFDPELHWIFYIELVKIQKGELSKKYPLISRKDGEAPKQYKLKGKEPGATAKNEYDKMAEMLIASRMLENIGKDVDNDDEPDDLDIDEEIELDESALNTNDENFKKSTSSKSKINFDLKFDEDELKIDNDDLSFLEDDFEGNDENDDENENDDETGNNYNNSGNYDDNYDDY